MRIGWIADVPLNLMPGGAELSSEELIAAAPAGVDVVRCTPQHIDQDVDAYVILNCLTYNAGIIPALAKKPVIKSVRDQWGYDDDGLRAWLLTHARLTVFNSLPHLKWFMFPIHTPTVCVPPPMNLGRFREAAAKSTHREGTLWIGAMYRVKGVYEAAAWARRNKVAVDFWGTGTYRPRSDGCVRYRGMVDYDYVPTLMAQYESFIFMPRAVEAFGRTVAEAWACGLELNLRGMIGAQWWIENDPDALDNGATMFWDATLGAI